ncbi:hypothetical protein [Kangiella shandongensis]|uniref:hypothetical protein n=1 Tax=Kangiella shandongensis TaxID=2763258 RepID=UPI001CBB8715|nr:hypothetical protein [Kangiella shandongensis]
MKYLIGLFLMVSSMVSMAGDDWYIGTWVIDADKTKEHSQHLTAEEKKLAERAQQAANKGFYEINNDYFKLFSKDVGLSSPDFYYTIEETDRDTVLLNAKESENSFELGQDAYGIYMLVKDIDYKMQDEKFGAKSFVVDENGEKIIERETMAKAYLKAYDKEIDREYYKTYKK